MPTVPRQSFRKSKLIQVIQTIVVEGKGTKDEIYREVIYYSDPETGKRLAVDDPCPFGKEK